MKYSEPVRELWERKPSNFMIAAIFLLLQGIAALSIQGDVKLSNIDEINPINNAEGNSTDFQIPPAGPFKLTDGLIAMIAVTGVILVVGIIVAVLLSKGCFTCGKFKEEDD